MTPDASYTKPIPYRSLPLSELRTMGRAAAEILLSEKNPDVLHAARRRFVAVRVEYERRGMIMRAGGDVE